MKNTITPEEHARIKRRRWRQTLGLLITVLVLIGFITVLRAGVGAVANLFDDTAQKQEYEDQLVGLVLFDPMPFDGIGNIDEFGFQPADFVPLAGLGVSGAHDVGADGVGQVLTAEPDQRQFVVDVEAPGGVVTAPGEQRPLRYRCGVDVQFTQLLDVGDAEQGVADEDLVVHEGERPLGVEGNQPH